MLSLRTATTLVTLTLLTSCSLKVSLSGPDKTKAPQGPTMPCNADNDTLVVQGKDQAWQCMGGQWESVR